jgi:hypothetical protein
VAALQTERAQVAARGRQIEADAAPIRYVAELVVADTDSERAIRWLISLMVMCCGRPQLRPCDQPPHETTLVLSTCESCRAGGDRGS